MKNIKTSIMPLGLALVFAALAAACSDGNMRTNVADANYFGAFNNGYNGNGTVIFPVVSPSPAPTTTPAQPVTNDNNFMLNYWKTGSSAKLDIASSSAANDYAGGTLDAATLWRVNVDLQPLDNGTTFGGEVKIAFINSAYSSTNAQPYVQTFTSGTRASENIYNRIVNVGGHRYYKGFFEDANYDYVKWMDLYNTGEKHTYGAVILIVDLESLDDEGSVNGEIWYLNYNKAVCGTKDPYFCYEKSESRCWFIKAGPYDCRDFVISDVIRPDAMMYPVRYHRLGTFQGLTKSKAFKL